MASLTTNPSTGTLELRVIVSLLGTDRVAFIL